MTSASVRTAAGLADSNVQTALERLDAQGDALIARTLEWSAINSGSREIAGLARMRDALLEAVSVLPGAVQRIALEPSARVSPRGDVEPVEHGDAICISVRPEAPIKVALTGHYDTVFPANHPFQTPRLREDGVLHGPGVADMKGGICVMLAALEAFEKLPDATNVGYEVLLSPDEEIGSPASAAPLAALGARSHIGMTYEPAMTEGTLVSARKGSGNFSLVFAGRAAHVGRAFADGRSAVIAAAEAALALDALNGKQKGVTVNVGAIDGGGPVNIVPDRAVLRFNVRAPDADAQEWMQAQIAHVLSGFANRDGVSASLHGGFTRPPKPLTPALETMMSWAREAGDALGLTLTFSPSGGVCEGNNLAAAGCTNIDTLGPCGGALHSDEEFAIGSSFAERAKLSFLLLAGFASGRWDPRTLRA
ncbi:MAG: hydrolase [Hyphomonadaceae bacterium]